MLSLGVQANVAQCLTTAFLLTMAAVIPITGFLLQRLNTRPVFMLAMSIFTAGTLICAASPGIELLIFGRVIQAVGTVILLPIYTHNLLGLDTLQTGMLLPGGLLMGLLAPSVGRLYDRIGPTRLRVSGAALVSLVLWALTRVDQNTLVRAILVGHIVISVGLALVFTPLFTAALGSVRQELYSHGSTILGSVQQVAGAVGIALFVALMSIRTVSLAAGGLEPVSALAGGIQLAFPFGAVISVFAIVAAFFVHKPEAGGSGMGRSLAQTATAPRGAPFLHQASARPDQRSASLGISSTKLHGLCR
ncbi:MAG: MFS transporter [Candidatus Devosia euplotis]|nr:MFS transporter [Candidatus Devosia euplotis]